MKLVTLTQRTEHCKTSYFSRWSEIARVVFERDSGVRCTRELLNKSQFLWDSKIKEIQNRIPSLFCTQAVAVLHSFSFLFFVLTKQTVFMF